MMDFQTLRSKCALLAPMCLLVLGVAGNAAADTITIGWDQSSSNVGYRVHVGVQSGSYSQHFDAGASSVFAFTTATAGQRYCFAVSAYMMSSGVEGPNSSEVCGYSNEAPTLVNPGGRTSTVGQPTSLQLQGFDSQPITYSARGLPPGFSLMTSTGYISGTGTTAGTYTVTARASDGVLSSSSQTFTWTMTTSTSTSTSTGSWSLCANEGGTCVFTGTQQVRYGANGLYAYRTLTGSTACTNAVFGDPVPGVVKQCHTSTSTSTSTSTGSWTVCANEGGTCAFTGTQQVQYGANGSYAYRTLTGGTACTNGVFGDPAPGIEKRCAIGGTSSTGSGGTTTTPPPSTTDSTRPTVTIVSPTNASTYSINASSLTLSGTASDNVAVTQVRWENNSMGRNGVASGSTNWTASVPLQGGSNLIYLTAIDAAGNAGTDTVTVTVSSTGTGSTGGTTSSTVSVVTPTTGDSYSTAQSSINLTGTAPSATTRVVWENSANGSRGVASGTTSWAVSNIPLVAGSNLIEITAYDAAGNPRVDRLLVTSSATSSTGGTGCATASTVQICTPTTGTSFTTTQSSINMTGTAPSVVTRVVWENASNGARGVANGTTSWSIASIPIQAGSNLIEITAYDNAGNPSTDRLLVTR